MSLTDDNQVCVDLWQIIAHYGYVHQKKKAVEELGGSCPAPWSGTCSTRGTGTTSPRRWPTCTSCSPSSR